MPTNTTSNEAALGQVREVGRATAEELRRAQEALETMHRLLLELSEQNLRLHRQNAAALAAMNHDLERIKAQLRRIAVARA